MLRRRDFIAGSFSLMATPALAQSPREADPHKNEDVPPWRSASASPGGSVFVVPGGAGDGRNWGNAAPLEALDDLIGRVSPGGEVCLLAGEPFQIEGAIGLSASGKPGEPVKIRGRTRDGKPAPARFVGRRTAWQRARSVDEAVDASDFGGNTLFKFEAGVSDLYFADMHASDFGILFDLGGAAAARLSIEDFAFVNIRDGIYTNGTSEVSEFTLRRFSGQGFSKKAVRFHGRCHSWLIEDCDLDSSWQYGDNFAVGIEAHDEAHGLRVRGGRTVNCMDIQADDPERYWNGDGVASERGNYDIIIENHVSAGNTDSGYDLKSEATILRNCVSSDNKRNYRLWGGLGLEPMLLDRCQSLAPHKRGGSGGAHHLWISGGSEEDDTGGSVLFVNGQIAGADPDEVIHVEGGNAAIHLVDTTLSGLEKGSLYVATQPTSVLIVGSARDPDITAMVAPQNVQLISGAVSRFPLETDGKASWRLVESVNVDARVEGSSLVLIGGGVTELGRVTVQARDTAGRAKRFVIETESVENPAGEGAVLALKVAADGALYDATGMHTIISSPESEVVEGAFHFRGRGSYFEVEPSANFALAGPFWIETEFKIEDRDFALPADVLTVWETSGNERAFRIGLTEDNAVAFFWSTDGRAQEEARLVGPQLSRGRFHKIVVDRGESGFVRLYVDGTMVAKSPAPVDAFFAGKAPLRVAGRPDGRQAASGFMRSLTIVKGTARCDSDAGCGK